jgi:hypothetical protein
MENTEIKNEVEQLTNQLSLKQVVDLAGKIIVEHINERKFDDIEFKRSNVEGYVNVIFTIEGFKFNASYNKDGYLSWHEWQGIKQPPLTKAEEKSICDYMWMRWNEIRKDTLRKEMEEKQKELETLL